MTQFRSGLRSAATFLLISVLCVFTVACGDSNEDFVSTNSQNNNAIANFVGRFLGANALNNNQTSALDLSVDNAGNANGTLRVNPAVVPQTLNINAGNFPVSGTVNLTTGIFSVAGNFPGVGPFSITGTLPTGSNQGSYQVQVNGQTFQGVIQTDSLGAPTIGNNGGGQGGGENGTSQLIRGGTLSDFIFSPDGAYNGTNPPVSGSSLISGAVGTGEDGTQTATIVLSETEIMGTSASIRSFAVSINAPNGEALEVGQTYQLASDNTTPGVIIALSTSVGTSVVEGWSLTSGTTGQATIIARDTNSITIDFQFTNVGPNSGVANNPSDGTFSTSGRVVGNFAANPG